MNASPSRRRFARVPLALALAATFAAAGASAQETVKIGFTGPLSGGAALYGKNVVDGMEMAI